ncbi:hypothetical protein CALVIDRAFT_526074 [Calocera viscosa TUFC12733]|uniref:Uncharacterized protein n=1 Tax=Calocera viscosa (strain TUFC12733) TaxID=1330018 RepID=A0A167PCQ5_CALVF|nr:hypothetical protein CALVIDRAFT_526074 [Calocera viscosa TUFC12733]
MATQTSTQTATSQGSSLHLPNEPPYVDVKLNYYAGTVDGSKPYNYITPDPSGKIPSKNWTPQPYPARITNLRGREADVNIDQTGFAFVRAPTKEVQFEDSEEALAAYYQETIDLLKQHTGAEKAVIFDHTIRRKRAEPTPDTPATRQPVPQVHVDQTPDSALARVYRHLPEEEAERRSKRRFQIINVWRPIGAPAYDMPLALADGRTVKPGNLVPSTLRYPDRDGETMLIDYSPEYEWYYVRGLGVDEAALIKCYDSAPQEGGSKFTPHTAFEDPTTPEWAKPRQSIELRALNAYQYAREYLAERHKLELLLRPSVPLGDGVSSEPVIVHPQYLHSNRALPPFLADRDRTRIDPPRQSCEGDLGAERDPFLLLGERVRVHLVVLRALEVRLELLRAVRLGVGAEGLPGARAVEDAFILLAVLMRAVEGNVVGTRLEQRQLALLLLRHG